MGDEGQLGVSWESWETFRGVKKSFGGSKRLEEGRRVGSGDSSSINVRNWAMSFMDVASSRFLLFCLQ